MSGKKKSAPGKAAARIQKRRADLIRAAVKIFSAKGFYTSTVNEIARAAGVSQGTVYNYIDTKADILYLVCSDVYAVYERYITEAVTDAESAQERLYLVLGATIDATFALQDHLLLLYQELHCLDRKQWKPFLRDAARLRGIYEKILAEAAAESGINFGHRRVVASIILMLPSTLIMRRWDLRGRVSEATMREQSIRFLLRGLGLPDDGVAGRNRRSALPAAKSRAT